MKLSCALAVLLAKNKQDITRTDNIYTQIKQPLSRVPSSLKGIKSCLPFMSLCPSVYAVSSIVLFIIRRFLLSGPSRLRRKPFADYLQNIRQMYLFLWVLQNALSENFIILSL